MNQQRKRVETLAHDLLYSYYVESDVEFLISHFAPDVVWLGAGQNQKAEGRDHVASFFREGKEDLFPCIMSDEHYVIRQLGEEYWFCQGDSSVEAAPDSGKLLKGHQRITFIFHQVGTSFEIQHIHHSLDYNAVADDELFPTKAGEEAYKQLQESLAEKDHQIDLMLSQLPGGMVICHEDKDFTIEFISGSLAHLLGYDSMEEFRQCTDGTCRTFIYPGDYDQMRKDVMESFLKSDEYYVEYRIVKRDGSVIWVSDLGKKLRTPDGRLVIYSFISDNTKRKMQDLEILYANQEVARQARFLGQLYTSIPCGIIQFTPGPNFKIISINPMVWQFYGFHSEKEYRQAVSNPFDLILE